MAEVFLLEDSRSLRRVLTTHLRDAGHNVTSFENGVASTDFELVGNADVLVTDIVMPLVGGEDVIINVQSQFPDLPIIAISGASRERLDALNVFGKLRKPFSEAQLTDLVQLALQSRAKRPCERD